MTLLAVKDVGISFGGVQALGGITLDLNRGEILGLIGPNGAGKTTLFNCISGVLVPDRGTIAFEDRSILTLAPHQRARRGIARTFQNLQLWGTMTVLENCMTPIDAMYGRGMVADALRLPSSFRAERVAEERSRAVLHVLGLLEHADQLAADLPVGIQRRVELARALSMRPKLLLLDEPASGLDATETNALAGLLATIRDRFKVSILLVDHDMSLVMRACDYIYVLDFGEMIAQGKPEKVREDPQVIAAYLGEAKSEKAEKKPRGPAAPAERAAATSRPRAGGDLITELRGAYRGYQHLLEVNDLAAGYSGLEVIRNINLWVDEGEVVACIGANGAGKTTTLRAISGVIKPTRGKVSLGGVDITRRSADHIVGRGMLHVPQGRGLFARLTVAETLQLTHYSGFRGDAYEPAFSAFPVLKRRLNQLVGTLSGGEQQMLALARAMLVKPKLLLIDEMSQGLAPAVVQQLFEHIADFKDQGIAVLLVEQFVESALDVADRAYVFEQGTVAHQAAADVLRSDKSIIASSYLGTATEVEAVGSANGHAVVAPELLESLQMRIPAELKRGLEERAAREGRDTAELVLELLGGSGQRRAKR